MPVTLSPFSLDRMVSAVEKVEERLLRATAALDRAIVPYAVVGGNAIFLWMTQHGEGGERFTPNVDLLIRRRDLPRANAALQAARFTSVQDRPDILLDRPNSSPRTRLRLLLAEEKVRDTDLLPNPDVSDALQIEAFSVLNLVLLVQTKLTAFRIIDRVHLRDMLDVGLIDQTWKGRYPPELAERLQTLIDDPDG